MKLSINFEMDPEVVKSLIESAAGVLLEEVKSQPVKILKRLLNDLQSSEDSTSKISTESNNGVFSVESTSVPSHVESAMQQRVDEWNEKFDKKMRDAENRMNDKFERMFSSSTKELMEDLRDSLK